MAAVEARAAADAVKPAAAPVVEFLEAVALAAAHPGAAAAGDKSESRNAKGPRVISRALFHLTFAFAYFLLFSYSSTYFFGFALNSSRQPVQQT